MAKGKDSLAVLAWWENLKGSGREGFEKHYALCLHPAGCSLPEMTFSHTASDLNKLRNRGGDATLKLLNVTESFLIHGMDSPWNLPSKNISGTPGASGCI